MSASGLSTRGQSNDCADLRLEYRPVGAIDRFLPTERSHR
jgi:hypothetical protein